MKSSDIHFNDWQRIFIGDVPGGFYLEVVFRIFLIYLILMISMRLMGKRMASQLSRNELIGMVSLAAAIGVPLQSPDRGILPIIVIAAIVISVQQLVASLATKSQSLEKVTQGNLTAIIEDGCLNLDKMQQVGITRERAFAQLRSHSIRHLGEVKRLYFEAGGNFTLIKNFDVIPGLPVLPIWDKEYQQQVSETSEQLVCEDCGKESADGEHVPCPNCGSKHFISAVK
ncbi:YetF domain-containing protein [Dyadobacter sp. CY343]|uniref:YetF domain-containing protein n=1 Tax=Dyadobacter sp. CY343 TaxID=2907299 RepID=UPI001F3267A1|nr:YetF domain-containing protein [Dyadobacter sp. CY343]MCE7063328.1 DUF421 domain-containing protein [Dyadobacter sp. CY343]